MDVRAVSCAAASRHAVYISLHADTRDAVSYFTVDYDRCTSQKHLDGFCAGHKPRPPSLDSSSVPSEIQIGACVHVHVHVCLPTCESFFSLSLPRESRTLYIVYL